MSEPAAKPVKSEQLQASDEIVEVAPGILRTQLPANITGLGHVNMYVMEDSRGIAVVDPGMPSKESWLAMQERLKQIGVPMKRVHSIIVTHSHPDHYGAANRLRSESGADIITHRLFRTFYDPTEPPDLDVEDIPNVMRDPTLPTPWGGPPMDFPWNRRIRMTLGKKFPKLLKVPTPTVRVKEADRMKFAGREWVALHTPGHTADHLCLFDAETGTLISGDHVLPTITPHISGLTTHGDPLTLFFGSLEKVGMYADQVNTCLPAHGVPFTNLGERVQEIKDHHAGRLQKLRDVSIEFDRPATVMEFAQHLFSPRAQGSMADSEAFAHLEHLRILGEFDCRERDGYLEYSIKG